MSETGLDGLEHFDERGKVTVVHCQAPGQFPDTLDSRQLRTIGRQEQQRQMPSSLYSRIVESLKAVSAMILFLRGSPLPRPWIRCLMSMLSL